MRNVGNTCIRVGSALLGLTMSCTALSTERPSTSKNSALKNPFSVREVSLVQQVRPVENNAQQMQLTQQPDPLNTVCEHLNELAGQFDRGTTGVCGGSSSIFPDNSGSQTTAPDSNNDSNASMDDMPSEVVLLVHGFSMSSGHDCNAYWKRQKDAIEQTGRTALIVGYYKGNHNGCDVNLSEGNNFDAQTPIEIIAAEFRDWIVENHAGNYVDIVAHSLGGIVARKMIDDFGHEMLISNVVTVASPHDGVKALFLNGSCELYKQCQQTSHSTALRPNAFMDNLRHNPQSIVPTQWTLIAVAADGIIGYGTGTQMLVGNTGGPAVSRYEYPINYKHSCGFSPFTMGHGDVHGDNAAMAVYQCDNFGIVIGSSASPHTRIMNAID